MKIKTAIILAGGKGTRLSEQTKVIPKPLVEVGGEPIMFHIMNHFVSQGIEKIIIAAGYKQELIRQKIVETYCNFDNDLVLDNNSITGVNSGKIKDNLKIIVVDTGEETETAQRIKKCERFLADNEDFYVTYGDSVSNVNLQEVEKVLYSNDDFVMALTAVQFEERFGVIRIEENSSKISSFAEKSMSESEFINGGFIACRNEVLNEILPEHDDFMKTTMTNIANRGNFGAYVHKGFWFAMDSQRDYEVLNKIYNEKPELFAKGREN